MSTSRVSRRHFLKTAGAVSMGFGGLHVLLGCDTSPTDLPSERGPEGFGDPVPDPQGLLDLPEGFTYTAISAVGATMDDGLLVPGKHDGMTTFPGPEGATLLVRNHEMDDDDRTEIGPFGEGNRLLGDLDRDLLYDPGADDAPALGGTTTLVYDTREQKLVGHRLSLAGTLRNCAGGPTPWGSWISCEETVQRARGRFARDHGYNFEVPAVFPPHLAPPVPLVEMGRFNHEAVAVDPGTGIVYQTEDRSNGLLYRYLPSRPEELAAGGRLQALGVRGSGGLDMRNWGEGTVEEGQRFEVEWVDLEHVDSPEDDLRERGHLSGAVRFAKGEGMWYGDGVVYFACTEGGAARKGQIWVYRPSGREGTPGERDEPGSLELFLEADDGTLLENGDNITMAPWGDLIVCEDGPEVDHLVGVTPEGDAYRFARNAVGSKELAGACFSPDGSTFFVNMQRQGLTLAITGPWGGGRLPG